MLEVILLIRDEGHPIKILSMGGGISLRPWDLVAEETHSRNPGIHSRRRRPGGKAKDPWVPQNGLSDQRPGP